MKYHYFTADIFTDRIFGGNQLAVFPDGRGLSDALMQRIAREFNFSETVFVFPPENPSHTRKLRIFTPENELPFAGHPTVGTAYVLAAAGEIPIVDDRAEIVFEEGVGPVPVRITGVDGRPVSSQLSAAKMPEIGAPPPPVEDLAAALSIAPGDIPAGADGPVTLSCGVPFIFVPVKSIDAVRRSRVNRSIWDRVVSTHEAPQIFIFSRETDDPGNHVHARMFAPSMNIEEDPATGSAAAALAGYLAPREAEKSGTLRWTIEQGFEMGRPSIIRLEADVKDGGIAAVRVGGESVMVCQGMMYIPEEID